MEKNLVLFEQHISPMSKYHFLYISRIHIININSLTKEGIQLLE